MQKNENPVVLSLVLLIISVAVALLLAFTNSVTKEKIAENTLNEQNAAKQEVLAAASEFSEIAFTDESGIVQAVYEGKDNAGLTVGWCVNVTPGGYGGAIDMMVGIDANGTISGMKIVSHAETAGLGAKAADPEFSNQYQKKPADGDLSVIKSGEPAEREIVALSGATITSKAVTTGVNAAAEVVAKLNGGV